MGFRSTEERKVHHLRISLEEDVESKASTGFEDVHLIHRCLPETDPEEIDLKVEFLGHTFKAPLFISAMTGGTPEAKVINANLAEVAEALGLGMSVGSQRAALENSGLEDTFSIVRERAPKAFISANIGFMELPRLDEKNVRLLIDMVKADALTIHLNALQEMLQYDAKPSFKSLRNRLESLVGNLDIPVIVKETGCGISSEDASFFEKIGVKALEIAGLGGTSWSAVEYYRNLRMGKMDLAKVAKTFWDWGIPTVAAILEARSGSGLPIIASGGIRSGLDVLKALVLGARLGGIALPLLRPAMEGPDRLSSLLKNIIAEIRIGLILIGASKVEEAAKKPFILTGFMAEWKRQRDLRLKEGNPLELPYQSSRRE
ncbi:MAG: type 2 isopentenyl-diphosphate Delta-isomerase [Candidatus Bathyarchaeia archaeon]